MPPGDAIGATMSAHARHTTWEVGGAMHKKKYGPIVAAVGGTRDRPGCRTAAVVKSDGTEPARSRAGRRGRAGRRRGMDVPPAGERRRLHPGRRRQRGDRAVEGGGQGEQGLAEHRSGVGRARPEQHRRPRPRHRRGSHHAGRRLHRHRLGGLWKSTDGGATFATRVGLPAAAVDGCGRGRLPGRRLGRHRRARPRRRLGVLRQGHLQVDRRRRDAGPTWASRTATRSARSSSTRATTTASSSPSWARCTTPSRRAACS